jgi:hypothetical protein
MLVADADTPRVKHGFMLRVFDAAVLLSETVGSVSRSAEPVSRNRPGRRS